MRTVLGLFVGSSCVAALILGAVTNYPGSVALAANSQTTTGVITSVEPNNHQSVHVSYSAEGRSQEIAWDGFPSASVGQAMVVYYRPGDSSDASLVWPRDLLVFATVQLTVLSLLFGLVATYFVVVVRRRVASR
jgi:predicted neutral ceramidase superfamily lipid hydrolase